MPNAQIYRVNDSKRLQIHAKTANNYLRTMPLSDCNYIADKLINGVITAVMGFILVAWGWQMYGDIA